MSAQAFDVLSDFDRGEYDCVHGYPALDNESDAYYEGYSLAYAKGEIKVKRYDFTGGLYNEQM